MGQVCLISALRGAENNLGAPKASAASRPLRLPAAGGRKAAGFEQGEDSGIDLTWLKDQVPRLEEPATANATDLKQDNDGLTLIEVQQFHPPSKEGVEGLGDDVRSKLEALQLHPDQLLHFGRDPELPAKDTLEFSKLEAWHTSLSGCVWDPNSLSSFWFELVNGAYGDVYRAKGLMNLPDGRAFFCNWMVSQESSQFLPLDATAPPQGRPSRTSDHAPARCSGQGTQP